MENHSSMIPPLAQYKLYISMDYSSICYIGSRIGCNTIYAMYFMVQIVVSNII